MKTFTYLGAECEYNFETKNLHITSKQSFDSPNQPLNNLISTKHNIKKEDVQSITFKHHHTQLPSHINFYFYDYPNLESIELEKLDFNNVETIDGFIGKCPNLKEISLTHKNAPKLTSIRNLINDTEKTKTITIKDINVPHLKEVKWLLCNIQGNIEEIIIEDITAPNIDVVNHLIYNSSIKTLDLTNIGDVNVHTIQILISDCEELETLNINPLTNTKEIEVFIENAPLLETNIMNKINQVKRLNPYFLTMTPKNETLDLDKFEDISKLASHLEECLFSNFLYPSIKIGHHQIEFSEYLLILQNNIDIVDKTEEEIVKEIIEQANNQEKDDIEYFLETLEYTKMFKNEEYQNELTSKLTIIKNLK